MFLNARFSALFGVVNPRQYDESTPLAHLRHISVFHLIASGSCTIEIASRERRNVTAGDVLLLSFADAQKFWRGDFVEMAFGPDIMKPRPVNGLSTVDHGGGGETTRMVCGFIESTECVFAPVFRSLPPLLIDRTGDDEVSAAISVTVGRILQLADVATPGTELMLSRLMELLFVEVIRHNVAQMPPSTTGWFAALRDPLVCRVLQLLHSDPIHRWTVEALAREAANSRTALAERFNAVLGQAPIEYLTSWRM